MAQTAGEAQCFRIAPNRLLVRHPDPAVLIAASARLDPAKTPIVDLGHARTVIRVEGSAAEDLLARFASIDFAEGSFPAGAFAQTGIHKVLTLIHRSAPQEFDLFVPVTWAATVWELLCENAAPFGYQVREG